MAQLVRKLLALCAVGHPAAWSNYLCAHPLPHYSLSLSQCPLQVVPGDVAQTNLTPLLLDAADEFPAGEGELFSINLPGSDELADVSLS